MSASKLWTAGYRDLISVIPPRAEIAPTSGVKADSRGKVPGKRRLDGRWTGYPWLQQPATERDIRQWEQWRANIGLHGAAFPGLDVDSESEQLTRLLVQEAHRFLGAAPVRTSRPPRRLLVYRTDDPFPRQRATIHYAGQEHVVELLGQGRQYLVYGQHPSGADYGWEARPLWDWAPDALTTIDAGRVQAFFQHLAQRLQGRAKVEILTAEGDDSPPPPQEDLRAPSLDALRETVAQIPNDYTDRETYIQVGMAIKAAAGGDEGFDIFAEWAARWESGDNSPETIEADWRGMKAPFRIGWPFLQRMAVGRGAVTAAAYDFEVDPDAPVPELDEDALDLPGYSDTWAVETLARRLKGELRYVPEAGNFHVWDAHVWSRDRLNRAEYRVQQELTRLSREVYARAAGNPDKGSRAKMEGFAASLLQRAAVTKALAGLQAHPLITLTVDDFDRDPFLLNTPAGTVDLRTGAIHEPDPAALMSRSTAAPPGDAEPARWLRFLRESTGGDDELQRYLQKLVGYSLTGSTQEQILCFIHGPPRTGKTVFLDVIGGLLGSYHVTAPSDTFTHTAGDRHPTDLAMLAGARLVTASETKAGRAWDAERVKRITGGDAVSARFMR